MSTKTFRSQVRDLPDSAPALGKKAGKRIKASVDRAPELGKRAGKRIKEQADQAPELGRKAGKQVKRAAREAQEQAPKLVHAARAAVVASLPAITAAAQSKKVRGGVRGFVRSNPLMSVLIGAAGVGAAVFAFKSHTNDDVVDSFDEDNNL